MTRRSSPAGAPASGLASRTVVVLVRPGNPENIGLVARAMKNTGFPDLRIVTRGPLSAEARRTAVHAEDVLGGARLFPSLEAALADRDFVLASTARLRRHATVVPLTEAVRTIGGLPAGARIALLFGSERTGLLSEEIERANLVFTIPQAGRQPSYNLGAAVLLTLYSLFATAPPPPPEREPPLPRPEQDAAIALILRQLEAKRFIHSGNKVHVSALTHDLLGRLAMTARDRRFLLALFAKGVDSERKESDDDQS
jgi:TrmH family RNA methyltransferase